MKTISNELQELVDSQRLSKQEAQLIHAIRVGQIRNPLNEETKEEMIKEASVELKEIETAIAELDNKLQTTEKLIDRCKKAIDNLENQSELLFQDEDFLDEKEKEQHKVLNKALIGQLEEVKDVFTQELERTSGLKKDLRNTIDKIGNIFEQSSGVINHRIEQALKEQTREKSTSRDVKL